MKESGAHCFVLLEALEALELEESKHKELDGCQGQGRDGVVLQACVVPDWLHTQELLAHDACHCCHSPAAIDLLSLSIPGRTAPGLPKALTSYCHRNGIARYP